MSQLEATQKRLITLFEEALEEQIVGWARWPATLSAACRHGLFGGGKRVRPLLSLMAAEAVGGRAEDALPWAIAVEMIHTYSLVHDDLPAMDDDDVRRGRPTCHVAFGEANAILAGDALLTEAFAVVAGAPWPAARTVQLAALLGEAAGGSGMVGGQVLDMAGGLDTVAALERMQALKTGALIRAAAEGGAIAAGGAFEQVVAVRRCGAALGLLFQITDDLLDRQQDDSDIGKNVLDVLDMSEAVARRDVVAAEAKGTLAPLGDSGAGLAALVDAITTRDR